MLLKAQNIIGDSWILNILIASHTLTTKNSIFSYCLIVYKNKNLPPLFTMLFWYTVSFLAMKSLLMELNLFKSKIVKESCRFLGMLNFYRKFIANATVSQAKFNSYLDNSKKYGNTPVIWTKSTKTAVEMCKCVPMQCFS